MPLTRASRLPPLIQIEGVRFALVDGRRVVRCIVTRDALDHLAKRPLTIAQLGSVFYTHRCEIESAAGRKYYGGQEKCGMITVVAADLTWSAEPFPTTVIELREKETRLNGALAIH